MTATTVEVRPTPTEHVVTTLDDTTGVIATMDRHKPWLGPATKATVDPQEPLYPHWAWMSRLRAGSAFPITDADDAIIGTTSVTVFTVTFDTRIASPGGNFALGWAFAGSVNVDMGAVTARLLADERTIEFTTAEAEVAPNTVTGTYTAATGDIVTTGAGAIALADTVVAFGAVPA